MIIFLDGSEFRFLIFQTGGRRGQGGGAGGIWRMDFMDLMGGILGKSRPKNFATSLDKELKKMLKAEG
jgi:hypothetical protein